MLRGNAKLLSNDFTGAAQDFDAVLAGHPGHVPALTNRSLAREKSGNLKGALEDCDAVVKLKPDEVSSYVNRSFVRAALGDAKGAIEDDTKAIHLAPDEAGNFYRRGKSRDKLGDKRGAALDWTVALGIGLSDDKLAQEARAYVRTNVWPDKPQQAPPAEQPNEAQRRSKITDAFKGLVSQASTEVWGANTHVTLRMADDKNLGTVGQDALAAIALADPDARSTTVTVIDRGGNVSAVVKPTPQDLAKASCVRGNARLEAKDYAGAQKEFTEALASDPKWVPALVARATAKLLSDDMTGALADFDAAISIAPDDPAARAKRSSAREKNGDLNGALEDLDAMVKARPEDSAALIQRSLVKSMLGDEKGALQDGSAAIHLDPNNGLAFLRRGSVRDKSGDVRGAALDWEIALALNPDREGATKTRDFVRANIWPKKPEQVGAETAAESVVRGKLVTAICAPVAQTVAGVGVQILGGRVHVLIRAKTVKGPEGTDSDALIQPALDAVVDEVADAADIIVTVVGAEGTVARVVTEPRVEIVKLTADLLAALKKRDPDQMMAAIAALKAKTPTPASKKTVALVAAAEAVLKLSMNTEALYSERCPDPNLAKNYRNASIEEVQWVLLNGASVDWVPLAATVAAAAEGKGVPRSLSVSDDAAKDVLAALRLKAPEVIPEIPGDGAKALRSAERDPFLKRKEKLAAVAEAAPGSVFGAAAKLETEVVGALGDVRMEIVSAIQKRDSDRATKACDSLTALADKITARAAWIKKDATDLLERFKLFKLVPVLITTLHAAYDKARYQIDCAAKANMKDPEKKLDYATVPLEKVFKDMEYRTTGGDSPRAAALAAAAEKAPLPSWAKGDMANEVVKREMTALFDALGLDFPASR